MGLDITDIGTWIKDNQEKIFRVLIYKKVFTPLELDEKYIDQGEYTSNTYLFVKIIEGIEIPNDVLLKMELVNKDSNEDSGHYIFKKLSDISIEEFDFDN